MVAFHVENLQNLEATGNQPDRPDVYTKLVKGYTEKQWGKCLTDAGIYHQTSAGSRFYLR